MGRKTQQAAIADNDTEIGIAAIPSSEVGGSHRHNVGPLRWKHVNSRSSLEFFPKRSVPNSREIKIKGPKSTLHANARRGIAPKLEGVTNSDNSESHMHIPQHSHCALAHYLGLESQSLGFC